MSKNDSKMACPGCQTENSIHRLRCEKCRRWLIRHHWGHERRWWLAGFLSILIPGLGHVYNGKLKKGVILFCVWTTWMGMAQISMMILMNRPYESSHSVLTYGTLFASFCLHLTILLSAIRHSVKIKNYQPKVFNKWYVYFLVLIFVFPIGVRFWHLRRVNLFHFYKIPSTSMMNTILPGDVIISNQQYYLKNNPQHQDLVLFRFPDNRKITFLKRIVGIPGDTLMVQNGTVLINGQHLLEPYVIRTLEKGQKSRPTFGPVVIPDKSYFVMGDNRTWSIDSRLFGPIHQSWIIGKPQWIFWSWNFKIPLVKISQKLKSIRLARFGKAIR